MFCVLLKKKLEIEAKVQKLQKKYLDSLKVYKQQYKEEEEEEEATSEATREVQEKKQELEQKSQVLVKIITEYKNSLKQFQELSDLIVSARQLALSFESELDLLASKLNIEYPPELIRREQTEEIEQESLEATGERQSDKIATEEDQESDKENNESLVESSLNQSNDEYYSPIIQIRKSTLDNREAYTPALKSSSKLPIRRRI
jgi:hypothetical protein